MVALVVFRNVLTLLSSVRWNCSLFWLVASRTKNEKICSQNKFYLNFGMPSATNIPKSEG